ncbi:threonine/serine dehydratase [Sulfitobacter sp. NFXS29]
MYSPPMDEFQAAHEALMGRVVRTPSLLLAQDTLQAHLPPNASVQAKLELFQQAGSFKARGAILGIMGLSQAQRVAGVVAASGGNHAMAVSWAAQAEGVDASIIMPETADPLRIESCRKLGATVTLVPDIAAAFELMQALESREGRTIMHPFDAKHMTLGAGSCGLEMLEDVGDADIYVIPVGGGGLISGMSAVIRKARPNALIFGVEPEGADSMARSFESGKPAKLASVATIADSLGSPYAMTYSFGITKENVDAIMRVSDNALRDAMRLYYSTLRLVAEPACAATLAAICGPLRDKCKGKKVAILACGSNISIERYQEILGG